MPLVIQQVDGDYTNYAPIVLKVTGYSKYKPDQEVSFQGIDGFWQLPKNLAGKPPPIGYVGRFWLKTNPKRGDKAKPGSMYHDIMRVEKVSDGEAEEPAGRAAPEPVTQDPREGYVKPPGAIGPNDQVPAEWTMPRSYYEARARSIERQVAAKIMGDMAAALVSIVPAAGPVTANALTQAEIMVSRAREMAEELWEPDREMETLPSESTGADQASYDAENEDPEANALPFKGPRA